MRGNSWKIVVVVRLKAWGEQRWLVWWNRQFFWIAEEDLAFAEILANNQMFFLETSTFFYKICFTTCSWTRKSHISKEKKRKRRRNVIWGINDKFSIYLRHLMHIYELFLFIYYCCIFIIVFIIAVVIMYIYYLLWCVFIDVSVAFIYKL